MPISTCALDRMALRKGKEGLSRHQTDNGEFRLVDLLGLYVVYIIECSIEKEGCTQKTSI